eukprot:11588260-Alexandrium_andersonii.AAC.1
MCIRDRPWSSTALQGRVEDLPEQGGAVSLRMIAKGTHVSAGDIMRAGSHLLIVRACLMKLGVFYLL